MKRSILYLAVGLLAVTGLSQTLNTNGPVPTLTGPFIDVVGQLATATNWVVAPFFTYVKDAHTWGGGIAAVYNITSAVGTMLRLDYVPTAEAGASDLSMVSANLQLQQSVTIANKVQVTMFGLSGIATPMGGAGTDNGTVQGVFGAGADFKIPSLSSHWSMAFDVEKWTAMPGLEFRFSPLVWKF